MVIRVISVSQPRKLDVMDTEPKLQISAIRLQRLVVPDEVVVDAAWLTELVIWPPVNVEWSSCLWIDDVLNELSERHWTVVLLILAIFHLDAGSDASKVQSVATKWISVYTSLRSIITKVAAGLLAIPIPILT